MKFNIENLRNTEDNTYRIVMYDPDVYPGLGEQLDELDEQILETVKKYLRPLDSEEWEPKEDKQTAEEYWVQYSKSHPIIMALDHNNQYVFGYAVINPQGDWRETMAVSSLIVRDEHRRKGISKSIMDEVFEWGKKNRYKYVTYHTQAKNKAARKFAEKSGFDLYAVQYFKPI